MLFYAKLVEIYPWLVYAKHLLFLFIQEYWSFFRAGRRKKGRSDLVAYYILQDFSKDCLPKSEFSNWQDSRGYYTLRSNLFLDRGRITEMQKFERAQFLKVFEFFELVVGNSKIFQLD